MPRDYQGTFENDRHRWTMMVDGVRHRVKCAELGIPREQWTKPGSYVAAKNWLAEKLQKLQPPKPQPTIYSEEYRQEWSQRHEMELLDDGPRIEKVKKLLRNRGCIIPDDIPADDLSILIGNGPVWEDRFRNDPIINTPTSYRLRRHADEFMALVRLKVKPKSVRELRQWFNHLCEVLTPEMDVRQITEKTVGQYYRWLKSSDLEEGTQAKRWGFFKRFMKWLGSEAVIETLPRNLHSPEFGFRIKPKKVKTYADELVMNELAKLMPRLRLYALLGLNTGCTQVDFARLTVDQYQDGKITRKRVKTEDQENVPTVTYPLWPETIRLLAECRATEGGLLLTSMTGSPLVESYYDGDGKEKLKDLAAKQWRNGKCKISLKAFRSIGVTKLESHEFYARYSLLFLGHSPETVKDKHYAGTPDERFSEAITWLGRQFGMVP